MPEENIHLFRFFKLQLFLRSMCTRQRFDENVVSFLKINFIVVHYISDGALFPSNIQLTMISDVNCVEIFSSRGHHALVNEIFGHLAIDSGYLFLPS